MIEFLWFEPEIFPDIGYFRFYEKFNFHAQLDWAWKMFYNLGTRNLHNQNQYLALENKVRDY